MIKLSDIPIDGLECWVLADKKTKGIYEIRKRLVLKTERGLLAVNTERDSCCFVEANMVFKTEKQALQARDSGEKKWFVERGGFDSAPRVLEVIAFPPTTYTNRKYRKYLDLSNGQLKEVVYYSTSRFFDTKKEAHAFIGKTLEEKIKSTERDIARSLRLLKKERTRLRDLQKLKKDCRAQRVRVPSHTPSSFGWDDDD